MPPTLSPTTTEPSSIVSHQSLRPLPRPKSRSFKPLPLLPSSRPAQHQLAFADATSPTDNSLSQSPSPSSSGSTFTSTSNSTLPTPPSLPPGRKITKAEFFQPLRPRMEPRMRPLVQVRPRTRARSRGKQHLHIRPKHNPCGQSDESGESDVWDDVVDGISNGDERLDGVLGVDIGVGSDKSQDHPEPFDTDGVDGLLPSRTRTDGTLPTPPPPPTAQHNTTTSALRRASTMRNPNLSQPAAPVGPRSMRSLRETGSRKPPPPPLPLNPFASPPPRRSSLLSPTLLNPPPRSSSLPSHTAQDIPIQSPPTLSAVAEGPTKRRVMSSTTTSPHPAQLVVSSRASVFGLSDFVVESSGVVGLTGVAEEIIEEAYGGIATETSRVEEVQRTSCVPSPPSPTTTSVTLRRRAATASSIARPVTVHETASAPLKRRHSVAKATVRPMSVVGPRPAHTVRRRKLSLAAIGIANEVSEPENPILLRVTPSLSTSSSKSSISTTASMLTSTAHEFRVTSAQRVLIQPVVAQLVSAPSPKPKESPNEAVPIVQDHEPHRFSQPAFSPVLPSQALANRFSPISSSSRFPQPPYLPHPDSLYALPPVARHSLQLDRHGPGPGKGKRRRSRRQIVSSPLVRNSMSQEDLEDIEQGRTRSMVNTLLPFGPSGRNSGLNSSRRNTSSNNTSANNDLSGGRSRVRTVRQGALPKLATTSNPPSMVATKAVEAGAIGTSAVGLHLELFGKKDTFNLGRRRGFARDALNHGSRKDSVRSSARSSVKARKRSEKRRTKDSLKDRFSKTQSRSGIEKPVATLLPVDQARPNSQFDLQPSPLPKNILVRIHKKTTVQVHDLHGRRDQFWSSDSSDSEGADGYTSESSDGSRIFDSKVRQAVGDAYEDGTASVMEPMAICGLNLSLEGDFVEDCIQGLRDRFTTKSRSTPNLLLIRSDYKEDCIPQTSFPY